MAKPDGTKFHWWLPGTLFATVTVILFAEFIFSDKMLYGEDTLALGYMARAYFAERLAAGDFPLWAPHLLGGIPFVESISGGDAIYPTSLLFYVTEPYRALGWKLVIHVLAAGFFMYGWARSLGMGRSAATVGGLAWLMAPTMVTLVLPGNDGKLMVAALTPIVFWATEALFRNPSARTVAALAGAVSLPAMTTQYQTSYFLYGTAGAYALFRTVQMVRALRRGDDAPKGRRVRVKALYPLALFLVGALLGAGLNAVQILPAGKYVAEASRRTTTTVNATPEEAIAYSSSWSFHPEEVVSLVVPEFVGNSRADAEWGSGTYWGRNVLKYNHEYLGITVIVFALLALFAPRHGQNITARHDKGVGASIPSQESDAFRSGRGLRLFFFTMSLLWLLFALGTHTPVWRVFYEIVPGISLFRVPALAAFLVSFGVTTLFTLGVDDLVRATSKAEPRARPTGGSGILQELRVRALLVFLAFMLLGLLLQSSGTLGRIWTSVVFPDATEYNIRTLAAATPFITQGFAIAMLFAAATVAVIYFTFTRKIGIIPALVLIGTLVAVDLGRIDRAFISTIDFHDWAAPNENTRFLQSQRENGPPFRVADLGSDQNVDLAMFGLDIFAGHHPNDLARYRTLLGLQGSMAQGSNTRNLNVLRILNVQYLLWPVESAGGPPFQGAQALSSAVTDPRIGRVAVYRFPPGLERAWFAGSVSVMDENQALTQILSPDFDPTQEVILTEPAPQLADGGSEGAVTWEGFTPEFRRLRLQSDGPGVLVISENWFPGWVAEVNGTRTEVLRANITLQAVPISTAGEHEITLRYTAPTVRSALVVSELSLAVVLLLLLGPFLVQVVRSRREKKEIG